MALLQIMNDEVIHRNGWVEEIVAWDKIEEWDHYFLSVILYALIYYVNSHTHTRMLSNKIMELNVVWIENRS